METMCASMGNLTLGDEIVETEAQDEFDNRYFQSTKKVHLDHSRLVDNIQKGGKIIRMRDKFAKTP
jgi:hypothetical protein